MFVEGQWKSSDTLNKVFSPYHGRLVAQVSQATADDAVRALAFAGTGRAVCAKQSTGDRRSVLQGVAAGLRDRADEMAECICDEAGKPIRLAYAEVKRAIETFSFAAAELNSFGGSIIPIDFDAGTLGYTCEVKRFPAGVVVGIVPFNFPLNLGAHKVAPALAVGAPIIIKPPPQAPSAQLILAEIVQSAGAPPSALQILPCTNQVAESLATDQSVRVLSFTGSASVGWALKAKAAGKVLLELGGNAAVLVAADADLGWAVERCVAGGFGYAGQVCIKIQRIYVVRSVFDEFRSRFLQAASRVTPGDPRDEKVILGPVIDDRSADRIEAWIEEAKEEGAVVSLGGKRQGRMIEATVLERVPPRARVNREEVFGPVVILHPIDSLEEGIQAINDSDYGLQAGLFTRDLKSVRQAFNQLEVGGLIVNDSPSFRVDNFPYGGAKRSGLGREGVRAAMEEFTEERVLVIGSR